MFGWSSPRRTSISPQTLLSFPLTFFFGMTLSATSTVKPSSGCCSFFDLEEKDVLEFVREAGAGLLSLGGAAVSLGAAAAPRRATGVWPGGTCHVARYAQ